jgi:hypothetical protein
MRACRPVVQSRYTVFGVVLGVRNDSGDNANSRERGDGEGIVAPEQVVGAVAPARNQRKQTISALASIMTYNLQEHTNEE